MSEERNHIKVFVSSTVYDFETDLRRIFATLDGFGYDVYMSKEGTIRLAVVGPIEPQAIPSGVLAGPA